VYLCNAAGLASKIIPSLVHSCQPAASPVLAPRENAYPNAIQRVSWIQKKKKKDQEKNKTTLDIDTNQ